MIKKMDKNKIEQKNECIMSSILIKIINIIKLNLNLINIYLKERKKNSMLNTLSRMSHNENENKNSQLKINIQIKKKTNRRREHSHNI